MNRSLRILLSLVMCAACIPVSALAGAFMGPYRWFPTSGGILGVACGRFDSDAIGDIAVAHPNERNVEILTGDASGEYTSRAIIPTPLAPRGIVAADFDADGILDLAAVGTDSSGVVILLGHGDGTFEPLPVVPIANAGDLLSVSDLDANGTPDLIVAGMALLNDGTGHFAAPIPLPADAAFGSVPGRIDGDPYPDLVCMVDRIVRIFFGNGDGTFGRTLDIPIACSSSGPLALGDFDHDGDLDIVVDDGCGDSSGPSNTEVLIMENGAFVGRVLNATSGEPYNYTVGDVDGDGADDVVATSFPPMFGGPLLEVLSRSAGGGFMHDWARDIHGLPWGGPIVADLNGDGRADVLFVEGSGVAVFRGAASGALSRAPVPAAQEAFEVILTHIDDGPTLDIATPRVYYDAMTMNLNHGDGTFTTLFDQSGFPSPHSVVFGEFNGDTHIDVVTCGDDGSLLLSTGRGNGTFVNGPQQTVSGASFADSIHADGDALLDLVVVNPQELELWHNTGSGFAETGAWPGGGNAVVTRDLDADQHTDVVVRRGVAVAVRLADGAGGFGTEAVYPTSDAIAQIVVLDLDRDGIPDVIAEHTATTPEWMRGRGDGTFAPAAPLAIVPASRVTFGDWNGDGRLDAASLGSNLIAVQFGAAGGSFSAPESYGTGANPRDLASGDLDGDGRPDLAVLNYGTYDEWWGTVDLLINSTTAPVGVADPPRASMVRLALAAPAPQPFRATTHLLLSLPRSGAVDARVLDVQGRTVAHLAHGPLAAGQHVLEWNGTGENGARMPVGVYFVAVRTPEGDARRLVTLLR